MIKKQLFLLALVVVGCMQPSLAIIKLQHSEKKVFTESGEAGVLEKIFSLIGTTNRYYVEFGVQDGKQCNTRFLREYYYWQGLLMDGGYEDDAKDLKKEFITAENINQLFEKYNVPNEFDLLCIDIDYNDFHVWKALDQRYKPRVVVIEYNATHLPNEDKVAIYGPNACWDGSNYFGASLLALFNLGRSKGYSLVYAEKHGVNLFFIRDDVLSKMSDTFIHANQPVKIYRKPKYGKGPNGGHPSDILKRQFVTSKTLLNGVSFI